MKVSIVTEYHGRNRYSIRVLKGAYGLAAGGWRRVEEHDATRLTVARQRNRACDRWSEIADEVEASEIPDAWDMVPWPLWRRKGRNQ